MGWVSLDLKESLSAPSITVRSCCLGSEQAHLLPPVIVLLRKPGTGPEQGARAFAPNL